MAKNSQPLNLIVSALSDVDTFVDAASTNIKLRSYQRGVAQAITRSIEEKAGRSFVIMFPRQSGKNELQAQLVS